MSRVHVALRPWYCHPKYSVHAEYLAISFVHSRSTLDAGSCDVECNINHRSFPQLIYSMGSSCLVLESSIQVSASQSSLPDNCGQKHTGSPFHLAFSPTRPLLPRGCGWFDFFPVLIYSSFTRPSLTLHRYYNTRERATTHQFRSAFFNPIFHRIPIASVPNCIGYLAQVRSRSFNIHQLLGGQVKLQTRDHSSPRSASARNQVEREQLDPL